MATNVPRELGGRSLAGGPVIAVLDYQRIAAEFGLGTMLVAERLATP